MVDIRGDGFALESVLSRNYGLVSALVSLVSADGGKVSRGELCGNLYGVKTKLER
jgi:hypothetical protein